MKNLELKDEMYLLKRLKLELDSYKSGMMEIMLHLDIRAEVARKFIGTRSDLYKCIRIGKVLDDITKNYIDYESISNCNGEIVDFIKVYLVKAEKEILETEMFLFEIENDDDIEDYYVKEIRAKLLEYKRKNIFYEFDVIQELLLQISEQAKDNYDGMHVFIDKIVEFNSLGELEKRNSLNDFCYKNIENSIWIKKLISLYNDYHGVEVIANINEVEGIPLFSRWDAVKLKPLLKFKSKVYFKIINTLNQLQQLNKDLLNIKYVERQIKLVNELQQYLNRIH
ncbi:MAG: hypothetical protein SOY04_04825 [Clostridium celatum]|nr:hypothetical protein [Clostridium celatum]